MRLPDELKYLTAFSKSRITSLSGASPCSISRASEAALLSMAGFLPRRPAVSSASDRARATETDAKPLEPVTSTGRSVSLGFGCPRGLGLLRKSLGKLRLRPESKRASASAKEDFPLP